MICLSVQQFLFGTANDQLANFNAALLGVCFATLLGLVDDVIDIMWRHKLFVGLIMTVPLLLSYNGSTSILLPPFCAPFFETSADEVPRIPILAQLLNMIPSVSVYPNGMIVNLGYLFYLYMASLVLFCTNAINIYAGINGLEVGQSIVIAGCISVMNLIDIACLFVTTDDILSGDGGNHLFSIMLMFPFIATSFALLRFNFYPARVFVGDVYPYYAGMCLAATAILGHFSKSLIFLVVPQIFNFVYSLPQLFHIVPLPRHRLPAVNAQTGFLHASKVAVGDNRSNMTLICLVLDIFGPMHERTLSIVLIVIQGLCGIFGLALRYVVAGLVFSSAEHLASNN